MEVENMNKFWRIPADGNKRTTREQNTLELLEHFLDYACEVLDKRGYVIITRKWYTTPKWIFERIYVTRADIIKPYLEDVKYDCAK